MLGASLLSFPSSQRYRISPVVHGQYDMPVIVCEATISHLVETDLEKQIYMSVYFPP